MTYRSSTYVEGGTYRSSLHHPMINDHDPPPPPTREREPPTITPPITHSHHPRSKAPGTTENDQGPPDRGGKPGLMVPHVEIL